MKTNLLIAALALGLALGCSASGPAGGSTTTAGGTTSAAQSSGSTASGPTGGGSGASTGQPPAGLANGAICTASNQCQSQRCGVTGIGHCCAQSCSSDQAECGAQDCDGLGACLYPAFDQPCGTQCQDGNLARAFCAAGACKPGEPQACPGHFACANALACGLLCGVDAGGCAAGFHCNAADGLCIPRQQVGACDAPEVCETALCLGGACCRQACNTADATCGAVGCDLETGACLYPPSTASCGTSQSCSGQGLSSRFCDAAGTCGAKTSVQVCPANAACQAAGSGASCPTVCADDGQCITGDPCEQGACCAPLAAGATVFVDPLSGQDVGCCGAATRPCNTLTFAMARVARAQVPGLTIEASDTSLVAANQLAPPFQWLPANVPAGETYPVHLGWGVHLHAPGFAFVPGASQTVFSVYAYPAEQPDAGEVTVDGDPAAPIDVGYLPVVIQTQAAPGHTYTTEIPPGGHGFDVPPAGQTPVPLRVSNANLVGGQVGLNVGPGGAVVLGPGSVSFGTPQDFGGLNGVVCNGTAAHPAALSDDPAGSPPVVTSYGVLATAFDIENQCALTLTRGPQLVGGERGILLRGPASARFGSNDPAALTAPSVINWQVFTLTYQFKGNFIFGNLASAIQMDPSADPAITGTPNMELISSFIDHNLCQGVLVNAGHFQAAGCDFSNNGVGVLRLGGTVDLSGQGLATDAGPNSIECSGAALYAIGVNNGSPTYPIASRSVLSLTPSRVPFCPSADFQVGADVANLAPSGTVNIDGLQLYQAGGDIGPGLWLCSPDPFNDCTCTDSSNCPPGDNPLLAASSYPGYLQQVSLLGLAAAADAGPRFSYQSLGVSNYANAGADPLSGNCL